MKSLEVQKLSALEIFESAIKSPITKQEYLRSLKRYFEFYSISDGDMYVKQDPDSIHDHLAAYINHEKSKGIKNHSVKGKLNAIFLFLEMNRVTLHKTILKKMLPADDEELGGGVPFTSDDISRMLSATDKPVVSKILYSNSLTEREEIGPPFDFLISETFVKTGDSSVKISPFIFLD